MQRSCYCLHLPRPLCSVFILAYHALSAATACACGRVRDTLHLGVSRRWRSACGSTRRAWHPPRIWPPCRFVLVHSAAPKGAAIDVAAQHSGSTAYMTSALRNITHSATSASLQIRSALTYQLWQCVAQAAIATAGGKELLAAAAATAAALSTDADGAAPDTGGRKKKKKKRPAAEVAADAADATVGESLRCIGLHLVRWLLYWSLPAPACSVHVHRSMTKIPDVERGDAPCCDSFNL